MNMEPTEGHSSQPEIPSEEDNLERLVKLIQQEGRDKSILRRNTLKTIHEDIKLLDHKVILGRGDGTETPNKFVQLLPRPIIARLSDQLEKSREYSYEILQSLIQLMTTVEILDILPYLVPRLVDRLGQEEVNEGSEEVRLIALNFLEVLVEKTKEKSLLNVYIDDLTLILSRTIGDDFFSVAIKSCKVTSDIAKAYGKIFHYNSERLIRPLCTSIVHQRYPVRLACVKCIGNVILFGNQKSIESVIPHLTQRLFDPLPQVRKGVVEVVGAWMTSFVDRYSYFHKFLPLLLTGIGDESLEVQSTATDLWSKVGSIYLEENAEDYKDQIDFPTPTPSHYPPNVTRPNLGCRILTHQHVSKLIPGIGAEITDWTVNTRIKSAQLLYNLILNSEEKITMHVEGVLQCLFKASQDEEPVVIKCVLNSAELIGYFVPFHVFWPIVVSRIRQASNDSGLVIATCLLNGTNPNSLEEHVGEIVSLIADKDICQSMKPNIQKKVLDICSVLINLRACKSFAPELFEIFISSLTVTRDAGNSERAYDMLKKLEQIQGFNSTEELFGEYSGKVLKDMKENSKCSDWTPLSAEKMVFDLILSQGGLAVTNNTEIILDIMTANLGPDKDPEVRLKFFTMLAKHFKNQTKGKRVQEFLKHVIEDVLNPNLIWTAGKTACALRTAAVSCLHACLQSGILDSTLTLEIFPNLESTLFGLIEDTPDMTRLIACETLRIAIEGSERKLAPDQLHKVYQVMLKRLDDVSNDVRKSAARVIAAVFSNVPTDYDASFFKVHLQNVFSVLLVHLDSDESDVQETVFETLCQVGKLHPDCLIGECEKMKSKHRSPYLCEKLITIFKQELINK